MRRTTGMALAIVWVAASGGGLAGLSRYQATPGPGAADGRWPADTTVPRAADGTDTLVVLIHPRCPCSRATIGNLAVLLAHCPAGRVATTVLFVRPPQVPAGWEVTDLWAAAAAIPGVTVRVDPGGVEAARFGGFTSGQALLYRSDGLLLFRGGLTPGRGHAGDSAGADAIRAVANADLSEANGDPAGRAASAPVFGCPLVEGDQCHR